MSPGTTSVVLFEPSLVSTPSRISTYSATAAPMAAEGAPRALPVTVGEDRERRRLQHPEVLAEPEPAAEPARPLGVLDEREAGDLHGVVQLGLLDRRVLGVLAVGLHRVGAVAPVPAAVATRERLVEARVAPPGHVERAEARLAHHPLGACRQPLRERRQEGAEHHLDEAGPASPSRRRPARARCSSSPFPPARSG